MSAMTKSVGSARVAVAVLAASALGVTFDQALHTDEGAGNWFSYFTNLSNLFGVAVLLVGGVALLSGRKPISDGWRGAAALYLGVTGLVYWTLLAGQSGQDVIVWANYVVHAVMPVAAMADWLAGPPARPIRWVRGLPWLTFPLAFLAYSLLRGPFVHWYPYDFLDPRRPGGYLHVTTWTLVVTAAFVFFMLLIVVLGNRLAGRLGRTAVPVADS
ncbi:Pr6Pr family membrane protein [Streptantibioticus ferralitis]|uniref:Pr6Pr family membrane protein n=1 Tax=Streptantibioticus ferralitis TaxID=236510 RepID=A0ABT5YXS7_9ACTN|nr:Pr6Pr family membrane protein [Streptantibioticus ferralitis]MDF2256288.1 Pr6Pr family membrane protein [Streptantibioticus ferralitis]